MLNWKFCVLSVSILEIGWAKVKVNGPTGENHSRPTPVELRIWLESPTEFE